MSTYIILANWTDQGIRAVKDSAKRLDAGRAALEAVGGEIRAFFMTMGGYDMVTVMTAPDDAAVARYILSLGRQGNLRTQTLKAFDEAEYRRLIGSLQVSAA
jgi:uncharacterized protein with GYD domain